LKDQRGFEIAKIISETDPVKPSSILTKKNANTTKEAINSKFKIQNSKSLKGDLDNIILKALKKEPSDRYASVDQFAEDLRRHQEGLPVSARPDTAFYRASKFARRHRTAVAAVALIFLTLLGGIVTVLWQQRRAVRRYEIARSLANNVLYKYHDEISNLPGSTRVREMLVKDAIEYLNRLQEDSAYDDDLRREIALAYYRVGNIQDSLYDNSADNAANALTSYANALKIQEELLAKNPNDLELRRQIGHTYRQQGESFAAKLDYQNALRSYENANENFNFGLEKKPDDLQFLINVIFTSRSTENLLDTSAAAKLENFRRLMQLAERGRQIVPGGSNLRMIIAMIHGDIASNLGLPDTSPLNRTDEAVAHLETAAEILRALADEDENKQNFYKEIYASLMMVAADIEVERGDLPSALAKNREAIAITESKAKAEPENANAKIIYAFALIHYARTLDASGDFAEAEKVFRQAHKLFDDNKNLMETIPALVTLAINLNEDEADMWTKQSKFSAALNLYQKSAFTAESYNQKMADFRPSESRHAARLWVKIGLVQNKIAVSAVGSGDKQKLTDEAARNLARGVETYKPLAEKNLLPLKDLRVLEAAQKELARL
jgi:non-specific serine/threonine protein kinase/serine/threonine-protein kinase